MTSRAWTPSPLRVHPLLEVGRPSFPGDLYLSLGEPPGVLAEHVQQHDRLTTAPSASVTRSAYCRGLSSRMVERRTSAFESIRQFAVNRLRALMP